MMRCNMLDAESGSGRLCTAGRADLLVLSGSDSSRVCEDDASVSPPLTGAVIRLSKASAEDVVLTAAFEAFPFDGVGCCSRIESSILEIRSVDGSKSVLWPLRETTKECTMMGDVFGWLSSVRTDDPLPVSAATSGFGIATALEEARTNADVDKVQASSTVFDASLQLTPSVFKLFVMISSSMDIC